MGAFKHGERYFDTNPFYSSAELDQGPCEDPDAHVADLHHEARRPPGDSQRFLDLRPPKKK